MSNDLRTYGKAVALAERLKKHQIAVHWKESYWELVCQDSSVGGPTLIYRGKTLAELEAYTHALDWSAP